MEPRWKDGCKAMLGVNAIFAGFSGVLLVNFVLKITDGKWLSLGPVVLALAAVWLFAFAAELITDALDEGRLDLYLRSMKAYNFGVVVVLLALALFLWNHERTELAIVTAILSVYPWIKDLGWLFFAPKSKSDEYRAKLMSHDRAQPTHAELEKLRLEVEKLRLEAEARNAGSAPVVKA